MKKPIAVSASLAALLALAAIGAKHFHDTYEITRKGDHAAGKSSDRSQEERAGARTSRQPRDREDILRRAREWNERLVAARPDLQIQYRTVPDENNGLLQLARFLDTLDPKDPAFQFPEDIASMRNGDTPWDSKKAAAWLGGKGELLARIEAIGLLADRSCAGVNQGYLDTKIHAVATLSYMLQVQARLALEQGDLTQGERSLRALGGLTDDLDRSEAPSLLSVVLASGLRTKSVDWAEESFPGKHGMSPGDLTWSRGLRTPATIPDLAAMIRGDWQTLATNTLLPALMGEPSPGLPRQLLENPEAAAELMANLYAAKVRETAEKDPLELMQKTRGPQGLKPEPPAYQVPAGISPEMQKAAEQITGTNDKVLASLLVGEARRALAEAAVAVALGEEPGSDPISGEPYRIDEKNRTVLLPDEPVYEGADAKEIPVVR
jgi:hypothetical protein